jgi:hypothetical protein
VAKDMAQAGAIAKRPGRRAFGEMLGAPVPCHAPNKAPKHGQIGPAPANRA